MRRLTRETLDRRRAIVPAAAVMGLSLLTAVSGLALARKDKPAGPPKHVTEEVRRAAIEKSQIWKPTNIPKVDLRAGPEGRDSFPPNAMVTCDYLVTKHSGSSPKFECEIRKGDVVRVKYGSKGEVEAEVLTTRLLWALGFAADRMYPVRLTCRGCPPDPWKDSQKVDASHVFDPASIERKLAGHPIESDKMKGWSWPELDLVDERQGGAPPAQRDALKLVAVLVQHSDSKPEQQRLLCPPSGGTAGQCATPLMMLNDVGQTFGRANALNRDSVSSVNFHGWSKVPIWKDDTGCLGHLSRSNTGTLENPKIGEAGRAFLAALLVQLTDKQLRDLFEVSRVQLRSREPGNDEPPASIDEWVAAFKHKRDEIVNRRCGP